MILWAGLLRGWLWLWLWQWRGCVVRGWPDGAPCIRRVLNSIDPAEGSPHSRGTQPGQAPFSLRVRAQCYRPGRELRVELEQREGGPYFRGFALQALRPDTGRREGAFTRDKNGAWKYQCLQEKAAITHAYNGDKTQLWVMWKTDLDHEQPIQFIATVVTAKNLYWTKGLHSVKIPHCRHEGSFRGLNKEAMAPRPRAPGPRPRRPRLPPPPSPQISPARGCSDRHSSCPHWRGNCNHNAFVKENCDLSCGRCRAEPKLSLRTTRLPTRRPRPTTTLPPPPPPTPSRPPQPLQPVRELTTFEHNVFAACSDKDGGCSWWTDRCFTDFHVRENCDFSCGRCRPAPAPSPRQPPLPRATTRLPQPRPRPRPRLNPPSPTRRPSPNAQFKGSSGCLDSHPECGQWRSRCDSDAWVKEHCEATCARCPSIAAHLDAVISRRSCVDRYANCGQWRAACRRDANIARLCPRTCGSCPPPLRSQSIRLKDESRPGDFREENIRFLFSQGRQESEGRLLRT